MPTQALPDRAALTGLVDEIVATLPSAEQRAYARSKQILFDRAYSGGDLDELRETPSSLFEFGYSEVFEGVKCVGIVLGTVKAVVDLVTFYRKSKDKTKPHDRLERTKKEWTRELVDAGIAPEQAERIAVQFSSRLSDVVA